MYYHPKKYIIGWYINFSPRWSILKLALESLSIWSRTNPAKFPYQSSKILGNEHLLVGALGRQVRDGPSCKFLFSYFSVRKGIRVLLAKLTWLVLKKSEWASVPPRLVPAKFYPNMTHHNALNGIFWF